MPDLKKAVKRDQKIARKQKHKDYLPERYKKEGEKRKTTTIKKRREQKVELQEGE